MDIFTQLTAQVLKMMVTNSNNAISDKNMSTTTTLSQIHTKTCTKEAVRTSAEAAKLLTDVIVNTDQTTRKTTTISQIRPKTFSTNPSTRYNNQNYKSDDNRSNDSTKISNLNTNNETTEILPQIPIPKWFRQQLEDNKSNEVQIYLNTEIY